MIHREKEGVRWLEFELFQAYPEIVHGVFLRHGGVSKQEFGSLNLSRSVGDEPEFVNENQKKILNVMGLDELIFARQSHTDQVEIVAPSFPRNKDDYDGLITQSPNHGLLITHADCQAAIFYDPIHRVIANVHSGWRGSVANIYGKTVEKMTRHFGTSPSDLIVCISPSLGPAKAEFIHYKKELPSSFYSFRHPPTYFNFWEISEYQLYLAGVQKRNIEIAKICTFEAKDDFFSYRREKKTGRNGTMIALKPDDRYHKENELRKYLCP